MEKSPIKDIGYVILPNGKDLTYDEFYDEFQDKVTIFREWWK